ncbi:MaoC family dehydratase [Pseudonocardia lacus]|uniref:MaoC family dehydratase n=1 Tax=Pseudonocardia lacus TaxID=2835865 RepID=UPI001BDBCEE3|nr:MaoC family dehydratase [Pseudonocardia lacus]
MAFGEPVVARNTAAESANAIHTEQAREYGFRGGIVPGVTLFGYAMRAVADEWGAGWLDAGELALRFRRPVYDGEVLRVGPTAPPDGGSVEVTVVNAEGERCAVGSARRDTAAAPDPADYPVGVVPDELLPAEPDVLGSLGPLAEYRLETSAEAVREYQESVGQPGAYAGSVPPSLISTVSARILTLQYRFPGPRIHVRLHTRLFGLRPIGTPLVARGRLVGVREHKGSHYSRLDLLVVDDAERPVMHIDTESIFSLGRPARTSA